jgi:hypothetical protein
MLLSMLQVAEYQGSLGVIQDGNANITALSPYMLHKCYVMLLSALQVAEYQGSLGVIQDGNANITALFPNELVGPASSPASSAIPANISAIGHQCACKAAGAASLAHQFTGSCNGRALLLRAAFSSPIRRGSVRQRLRCAAHLQAHPSLFK